MKLPYRLFQRSSGVYFLENRSSKRQESLRTKDRGIAARLLHARNEAELQPAISREIAKAYWMAGDPLAPTRTWQMVFDEILNSKRGANRARWEVALRQKPLQPIRSRVVLETRPEHFLAVLTAGTVSTNQYLRRVQNFALDMTWLAVPILPRKQWPAVHFKPRRGITIEEHGKILAGERNPEWIAYYKTLWHTGGAQSDIAGLTGENIDWDLKVISFHRRKSGSLAQLHFGPALEQVLSDLPGEGPIFPRLSLMTESDRASLFRRRCRLTGVSGVCLHSYRYAWAERAKTAGYPERFAQEALGHNSRAIHRAYARAALVRIPPLEEYEKQRAAATGAVAA
jgi:integrase